MTSDQIKYILESEGFKTNTWTTLAKDSEHYFNILMFNGEDFLSINPKTLIMNFDPALELIYVNRMDGILHSTPDKLSKPVEITYNNKKYYVDSLPDSVETSIGYITEIYDFKQISSITKRKR